MNRRREERREEEREREKERGGGGSGACGNERGGACKAWYESYVRGSRRE